MNRSLSGSIALTKLKCYVTKMTSRKQGKPIDVLIIPVDDNLLIRGKEGALYLPVRVVLRDEEDQYGQHGFISQTVDGKTYKEGTDEQKEAYKKLPILGNLKDFANYQADADGIVADRFEPVDNQTADGLPF